jgi:hypothetical protein
MGRGVYGLQGRNLGGPNSLFAFTIGFMLALLFLRKAASADNSTVIFLFWLCSGFFGLGRVASVLDGSSLL